MLYFREANLAFVAVPKTGGTAIETALEHMSEVKHDFSSKAMHFSASYIKQRYGRGVEVVGLIREPVSWLFSKYRYLSGENFKFDNPNSTRLIGFDGFLKRVFRGEKAWPEPMFFQSQYLEGADTVFQYEQFGLFVQYMNKRLGSDIKIPLKNVSPQVSLEITPETIDRILLQFKKDADMHRAAAK